jgi:transposase
MGSVRRNYTPEFKRDAVRMALEPGRTVVEVARRLGIGRSLLQRWKREMKANGEEAFAGDGAAKATEKELARLRRELARTQQERDILKKALAYFAKERN